MDEKKSINDYMSRLKYGKGFETESERMLFLESFDDKITSVVRISMFAFGAFGLFMGVLL